MTAKRFKKERGTFWDKDKRLNMDETVELLNELHEKNKELKKENEQLKQQLFETNKELLWATSDEVDRALHYEDEVEELRKERFEMTEKRWKIHKIQDKGLGVFDLIDTKNNNKYPLDTQWEICALVRDLLNELDEENQQLKLDKTKLHLARSRDRVNFNQFRDKVFCHIDCKIKLLKESYMSNEVKILEDLREELIE